MSYYNSLRLFRTPSKQKGLKLVKKNKRRVCCETGCLGGWISITFVIPPTLSFLFLSHPLHSMWHSFISQVRLASPSPMSAVPVTTNLGMSWRLWWVSAGHRRQTGCYVRPLLCTAEARDSQHNQTNDPWRLRPSGRKEREREGEAGVFFFFIPSLPMILPREKKWRSGKNYCTVQSQSHLRWTGFEGLASRGRGKA